MGVKRPHQRRRETTVSTSFTGASTALLIAGLVFARGNDDVFGDQLPLAWAWSRLRLRDEKCTHMLEFSRVFRAWMAPGFRHSAPRWVC